MLGASCYLLNPFNELCVLETVSDNVCLIFFFLSRKNSHWNNCYHWPRSDSVTQARKRDLEKLQSCHNLESNPTLGYKRELQPQCQYTRSTWPGFPHTMCWVFFFFGLPIIALALLVYCQQVWETGPPTSWIHRASVLFSINLLKLNAQRCLGNEWIILMEDCQKKKKLDHAMRNIAYMLL